MQSSRGHRLEFRTCRSGRSMSRSDAFLSRQRRIQDYFQAFFVILIERMSTIAKCLLAAFLTLPVFGLRSNAQGHDTDIKFRLAQSYERSGDIEAAVKLYSEMYA